MNQWTYNMSDAANPFDWRAAALELATSQPETGGQKLSFFEQCQAFAALKNNIAPRYVAIAFGISRIAVSQLHNCLHPDSRRYNRVREEFDRCNSEDAFLAKYYDQNLHTRIAQAKYDVDQARLKRIRGGPNPNADSKAFKMIGAFEIVEGEFWRVDFLHQTPIKGWYFANCQADGKKPEIGGWNWHGFETIAYDDDFRPFRKSVDAWRAAYKYCNHEPPAAR